MRILPAQMKKRLAAADKNTPDCDRHWTGWNFQAKAKSARRFAKKSKRQGATAQSRKVNRAQREWERGLYKYLSRMIHRRTIVWYGDKIPVSAGGRYSGVSQAELFEEEDKE